MVLSQRLRRLSRRKPRRERVCELSPRISCTKLTIPAADEGPKQRKQKKAAVEEAETEEKPKAKHIPTKASAQRIPKELDPARQDADSGDEEDEGILTVVEKLDPEPEDVAAITSTYEAGTDVGKIPKSAKKAARAAAAAAEE